MGLILSRDHNRDALKGDIRAGVLSVAELAKKYQLALPTIYYHIRAVSAKLKSRKRIEKLRTEIRKGGYSVAKLAKKYKLHRSTVYYHISVIGHNHTTEQKRWARRCPQCGAKILTRECVACSIRGE